MQMEYLQAVWINNGYYYLKCDFNKAVSIKCTFKQPWEEFDHSSSQENNIHTKATVFFYVLILLHVMTYAYSSVVYEPLKYQFKKVKQAWRSS